MKCQKDLGIYDEEDVDDVGVGFGFGVGVGVVVSVGVGWPKKVVK